MVEKGDDTYCRILAGDDADLYRLAKEHGRRWRREALREIEERRRMGEAEDDNGQEAGS